LAVYSFLQVPGGESAAVKLVIIAVAVAMGALLLSEWLARRMARKVSGA
ncbi:MAG: molybdate ABC transporter permease subunit, partial [Lentibacter algarum]